MTRPSRKTPEEQKHYRVEGMQALESPTAEGPLPDRLRIHVIIAALWEDNGPFARSCLLEIIAQVPLRDGPWRALKRIFKEAEARDDTEVFGGWRLEWIRRRSRRRSPAAHSTISAVVPGDTCAERAESRPACYADVAADVLARYEDTTPWHNTWVANHIFYHETGDYTTSNFHLKKGRSDLNDRAFAALWQRSPRPLFGLLKRARSDRVRQFAADCLKADFRASLREVEPAWVARLVSVGSGPADEFVVWVLNNVPKFEQGAFRSLGLHQAVLRLFDSPSDTAGAYAAEYARTHARDLPVDELVRLVDNRHGAVRKLAVDLIQERDPRKKIGLDAWGRLLESTRGQSLAATALRKHFGPASSRPTGSANGCSRRSRTVRARPEPAARDSSGRIAGAGLLRRTYRDGP